MRPSAKKTAFRNREKRPFLGLFLRGSGKRSENFGQFLPTFFAGFSRAIFSRPKIRLKIAFCPKKVGFCPFIFQKWAAGNRCGTRVCGFSAHFPTFSLHYYKEKTLKIYISGKQKWAFGQRHFPRAKFGKNFLRGFRRWSMTQGFAPLIKFTPFQVG